MQTTPETAALLAELLERSSIVTELDGPQIEAWVSGLFPVFDETITAMLFVDYCAAEQSSAGALVCAAIAELTAGLDLETSAHAQAVTGGLTLPAVAAQIGGSELTGAWMVVAPFGRSIVLGFDNQTELSDSGDEEPVDLRHSILIEISVDGGLEDVQLAGAPQELLDEASESGFRVVVESIELADAQNQVVAAWPADVAPDRSFGPGLAANQQFVRRRLFAALGVVLPPFDADGGEARLGEVDTQRGLSDSEFAEANRAARSTLQAALGADPDGEVPPESDQVVAAWAGVIRATVADLAPRELDALLWLEWADWLGAGIGLSRAGVASPVDGATLVDLVNRCPEVSSTIDKADREYAEWAFGVAIDLLVDAGAVEDARLTDAGHRAIIPALFLAWNATSIG